MKAPRDERPSPDPSATGLVTGYQHRAYAESLEEFGTPIELPLSHGWLLARPIPDSSLRDAMGCYPLFSCVDWPELHRDLDNLVDLVSVAAVVDPFADLDPELLRRAFRDVVIPMKRHYVADLSRSMNSFVSSHHQRCARYALRSLTIETCQEPLAFLDDWVGLYGTLIERHGIAGIRAFSRKSFAKQLSVPGVVVFRAGMGESVGMLLWYVRGSVAYYHLGASSETGYRHKASFGLFWRALEYFADRGLKWVNLGGDVGTTASEDAGLGQFKRGWSTGSREVHFCGRIIDRVKYEHLSRQKGAGSSDYFPVYRTGEFT